MWDTRDDARWNRAETYNHPDPARATPGEINILSMASLRAGRIPTREEAEAIIEEAERISDFNDTINNGS